MFRRTRYQQGSLSKEARKSGDVWIYRWRDRLPTGDRCKRKQIIGTVAQYRTESAARRAVEVLHLDINNQSFEPVAQPKTVAELIEHYKLKELGEDRPNKAATTCNIYRLVLKNWIGPRWGGYRLTDVRTVEVEEWLRSPMQSKGRKPKLLAPGTRAKVRNLFSALFSHGIRWGFVDRNPITGPSRGAGVRQTSGRLRTPMTLDVEEIAAILRHLPPRERSIVFLFASTGFRASELRGLQWQDIDFDAGTINLQRGVVGKHVSKLKTAGSHRLVPISAELAAVLFKLRQESPYNKPEDWILASPEKRGKSPIWLDTLLDRKIRPAVAAAGINKVRGLAYLPAQLRNPPEE